MDAADDDLRVGAVILAGGSAARMGGADKGGIELDGVTLLERALAATMTAVEVVVVGEQVPTTRPVTWTMEDPRGGGPAAGLLAGLDCFYRRPDVLQVLAVDMPQVQAGTMSRLADALRASADVEGAVLVDADGRTQPLCGVYRFAALERVRPDAEAAYGMSMRALLAGLSLLQVAAVGDEARDVDTWSDLRDLRDLRDH